MSATPASAVSADEAVRRVTASDQQALTAALEAARDFRGDVTLELAGGSSVEGFVYDRATGKDDADARVRLLPKDGGPRVTIEQRNIVAVAFTGKDAAAGKTWENWVRRYAEKRLAGEKACLESEKLD
jgi:hypothetical protein